MTHMTSKESCSRALVVSDHTVFEVEEVEDDGIRKKDEEKEAARKEEETIFIPLGYPYELPQTFYKGSDPEWQSFVRLARNRKKCAALKNELTGIVGRFVGAQPQMETILGKGNQPKKYWLDIDYPQGPPPEYERKGPQRQESAPTSENDEAPGGTSAAGTVEQPQTSRAPSESGISFQVVFPPPGMAEDLAAATEAFQTTFARTWQPATAPPERGTVLFSGMIELVGPKGIVVLDTIGAYHAADSRWTKVSVAVRRMAPRKQGPRMR
ncbi:MAG: hypothetical protein Q9223_002613 [Gallowayella weberi]